MATTAEPQLRSVSAAELRHAIGHLATGVTIVTSLDAAGAPVGTTVSAVTSLSAEPALLLVCLSRRSVTLGAIRQRGSFTVNVLAADQHALAANFARPGAVASWDGVGHRPGPAGNPWLDDVVAALECTVDDVFGGGDHEIVIGRVHFLDPATTAGAEATPGPLLHWRGAYARLVQR